MFECCIRVAGGEATSSVSQRGAYREDRAWMESKIFLGLSSTSFLQWQGDVEGQNIGLTHSPLGRKETSQLRNILDNQGHTPVPAMGVQM